jgi:hypothetical protein
MKHSCWKERKSKPGLTSNAIPLVALASIATILPMFVAHALQFALNIRQKHQT